MTIENMKVYLKNVGDSLKVGNTAPLELLLTEIVNELERQDDETSEYNAEVDRFNAEEVDKYNAKVDKENAERNRQARRRMRGSGIR